MTAVISEPHRDRVRREDDAHAWALQQARSLRQGSSVELDLLGLADEIADLGNREYLRFQSALSRVVQHLLKWDCQTARRSRSWVLTIDEHRDRVRIQLDRFPSLKGRQAQALEQAYRLGRNAVLRETTLPESALPNVNPYGWDAIMTREIVWPED